VEFRILGPLEVRDGDRILPLGGTRRRAVLGLLLLDANRVVPVDRLVDGVWGDSPPASAHASLQNQLARLRQELGDRIKTRAPGYLVRVAPGELDLDRFHRLVDEARGADPAVAAERLRDALALWRGAPLADLAGEPAGAAAAHLEEVRLATLEDRIEADLALGRHAALIAELEELVAREPYRERPRRQLMLALYRSGRQADALEAYADGRRAFVDELGTEPGRELRELQRAVLRRDPALDAPAEQGPPPGPTAAAEARKTVTVLLADVAPEDAPEDPEARRADLHERSLAAERELERYGAAVQTLGAGRVLAVFGVPAAQDDDSLRAVRAALALRASARVGLATGEVVTGDPLVSGAPVDEAARLCDWAATGEVLAGLRTLRLVRHAVTVSGRDGVWKIEELDPAAAPLPRHLETPLVGRARELEQVAEALEHASADARAQLVTIFGAPGIGKTRLAAECVERLRGRATPAVAHCNADEQGLTYAPLREALEALAEGDVCAWIRERLGAASGGAFLAEQLVAAITGPEPGRIEDTAWAVRRLLAGLAEERPLLLVFEDVHWAPAAFLDVVESVVELARAPLLVVCLARPDLLDSRPHWGGGGLISRSILLDALTEPESEALVDRLAPADGLDASARERILAVAEGNPLFIEQLLAAALEGDAGTVPDTIQTLLAARLDRLAEPERAVAQAAAVCGRSFSTEDVAELIGADPSPALLTLVRRELVRPGDPGGDEWAFRHSLIRDVAYGSLPKWRRAELHERLAERAIARGVDVDVSAGYHLDQAVRARREAGERGAGVDRLGQRAGEHLRRAGLAAFESEDPQAAAPLLGRANELLPRTAPERVALLPKLGQVLIYLGHRDEALALIAEARSIATDLGDVGLMARTKVGSAVARLWSGDAESPQRMLEDIDEAVPVFEQLGDYEGLAMAELVRFHALDRGRLGQPYARIPLGLEYARKAGARLIESQITAWMCITLPRGTMPVGEGIALVSDILETSSSAYERVSALGALGLLRAMKGDFDDARRLVREVLGLLEELGLRQSAAAHSIAISEVETMAGDDASAERLLRDGYEAVTGLGDPHSAVNVAWRLGLALARQGQDDEAERFARIAAGAEFGGMWVDVWSHVVLALVEAHRGNAARVEELVDQALEPTVWDNGSGMHVDALLECAEALRVVGFEDRAAALIVEAAGHAEQLGYTVSLRRAQEAQRALTA
jgi:DNA-binding SARP family transcriptional activator/tetratricopeptide (TPR) repeat protein